MDEKLLKSLDVLLGLAYSEDINDVDITTNNLIHPNESKTALFVAKENGIIAGLPVAEMVFRKFDMNIEWKTHIHDGGWVRKGDTVAEFSGSYCALLSGERTALNFIQRMSGIATLTNQFVKAVEGTNVKILDTRKTLPGYRFLDKYSVRVGGATNHRIGLYDMVMIKDNHIKVAGGIKNAIEAIRPKIPISIKIEIETSTLEMVQESVEAGADIIMFDNMKTETMAKAVKIVDKRAKTEASGNISLQRIREVAETGVDFISVGALTHSVKALDISQQIL
ncbi:MAG: carboxylating nicotinate-nucleotide diphosphorylase [Bacteroidales bacterium]|jgi:nicotinate-nucleotide pyrophosphorylase (carboxylating)|nr:carboxylating nicotinate-nucleotide diphosphorylase [Bacteroidales bacterium]